MVKRRRQKAPDAQAVTPALRRPLYLLLGGALASLVAAVAVVVILAAGSGSDAPVDDGVKRAVIVDQLELTQPNPDFVSSARGILASAGYQVDYVEGSAVTVDFYRTLPSRNYDLILLRVHAGITTEIDAVTGERTGTEYVSLFTGEPYDETKYSAEQLGRLGKARYQDGEGEALFGIGPEFVRESMEGDFNGAVVVLMGCDGLRSQTTAEAFLDRGASSFVSWTNQVSAPHTDRATEKLLTRYAAENLPIEQAVQDTAAEVGADPTYDGELRILTS